MGIYETITSQVLDLMEEHGTDWTKPWTSTGQPHNPVTGNDYHGVNVLLMGVSAWRQEFSRGAWATYKQWQSVGAQVRRGEKGTPGLVYKTYESDGETKRYAGSFSVFNAEQVDGWNEPEAEAGEAEADKEQANWFVAQLDARVKFASGCGAFYSPSQDQIVMPLVDEFHTTDGFYGTLLHELTHWTGHKDRLDRFPKHAVFGSDNYAREELVAEIGSALLCVKLGVSKEPRPDHAKYLNAWIDQLRKDKTEFVSAAAKARAAVEFMEASQ